MSPEERPNRQLLAAHSPSLASLVFGLGFGLLRVIVLSDTSLDSTGSWLWAMALIIVGLAAMVSVLDGLRSRAVERPAASDTTAAAPAVDDPTDHVVTDAEPDEPAVDDDQA